jgi:SOS response regulatory protein OraA/RecX
MGPRVTGLQPRGGDRVAVELDGSPWRVLPADAVVRARIVEGLELDRERVRLLRRELRRSDAVEVAAKTLRRRDVSAHELDARLTRAGVSPAARQDALSSLTAAGLVDDERLALVTVGALARRGWGDAAIRFRLEGLGIGAEPARRACGRLEAESERAARLVATRGRSAGTAAYLARRGFSEDTIEDALGSFLADAPVEGYDR